MAKLSGDGMHSLLVLQKSGICLERSLSGYTRPVVLLLGRVTGPPAHRFPPSPEALLLVLEMYSWGKALLSPSILFHLGREN